MSTYRITVSGCLGEWLSGVFGEMRVERAAGETTFVGDVADQVQLHGLLERIRDFGLELTRVERTDG